MKNNTMPKGFESWKRFPCREKSSSWTNHETGEVIEYKAKTPWITEWKDKATNDHNQITRWERNFRGCAWGYPTGEANGFFVIDEDRGHTDGVDGVESLKNYCAEHGHELPQTLSQRTAGGGVHLLFKMPTGIEIKNTAGLLPGVDVRGTGGYIIGPPSINQDNGGRYEWVDPTVLIADPPEWILQLIAKKNEPKPAQPVNVPQRTVFVGTEGGTKYGLKALRDELEYLRTAPEGTRNDTLNRVAVKLFSLVKGNELDEQLVRQQLEETAKGTGLTQSETLATLNSAWKAATFRNAPDEGRRPTEKATAQTLKLPSGFYTVTEGKHTGLYKSIVDKAGEIHDVRVGDILEVLAHTRDDNHAAHGLLLRWHDGEVTHERALSMSSIVGKDQGWLQTMVDEGYRAEYGQIKALGEFLTKVSPIKRVTCVHHTGWNHNAFVLPDFVFYPPPYLKTAGRAGNAGKARCTNGFTLSSKDAGLLDVLDKEEVVLQVPCAHNPFQTGGTLEAWQQTIGAWARGNSRLMLYITAALAGPLLYLINMESGGFNLVGKSATGKTVALCVGASVWGKGTSSGGFVQNWRATGNGLEAQAALHSDTILALDELGQAPARTVTEASYLLCNGVGKGRALQDGSLRAAKSWRVIVLSTGELGLEAKLKEEVGRKARAGELVRLVDVPADAGAGMGLFEKLPLDKDDSPLFDSPRAFADELKQAAATNYGHIARKFLEQIQQHREEIEENIRDFINEGLKSFCKPDDKGRNPDSEVQRVAKRFLLCAAAGEKAAEWGILPWEAGEATEAVFKCFNAWLAGRGGVGASEDAAITEQVQLFLEQHGQSRFQDAKAQDALCINRAGFRLTDYSEDGTPGTFFYVLPETFKSEVCKGFDHKRAAAVLAERKLLLPGDSRSFTRKPKVDLPGFGRKRCYTLFIPSEAA